MATLPLSSGAETISVIDAAYCGVVRAVTRAAAVSANRTEAATIIHRR